MTGLAKGVLNISAFMERGVIQDDNGGRGQLGQEDVLNPGEEGIGVDTALEQTDGDQVKTEQGTDGIRATPGVPVKAPITPLPDGRVTPATRHVLGKAALVNPHQRASCRFIARTPRLKGPPCPLIRARVREGFF